MIWQQAVMTDGRTLEGYAKELENLANSIETKMARLIKHLEVHADGNSAGTRTEAELMTGMVAARGLVATLRHPQASKVLRETPDWQLHLHRTEKRLRAFDGRLQQRLEAYQSGV
jgi:hypothetical protein